MNQAMAGNSTETVGCAYYIEMLCDRYRDRGIATHVRADAALQERNEALTRAMAPGAYVRPERVSGGKRNKYRSGTFNGIPYMTADDFAAYYKAQRGYKTPDYSNLDTREEETVRVEPISARAVTKPPKKAVWLTETEKLPTFLRALLRHPVGVKLNELAADWFPVEKEQESTPKEKQSFGKRFGFASGVMASLVMVAFALTMIVGSSVMVSHANSEIADIRSEYEQAEALNRELGAKMEQKDDMLAIGALARSYGMVSAEYISSEYAGGAAEDSIVAYPEEDGGNFDLSAILSAIGFK